MQLNPLISIVVPVFNRVTLLEDNLKSIINQSYRDWELILVDDGSSEETLELVYKYQRIDSRIRIVIRESEKKGSNSCRNIGITNAKGQYLIFLDSDDILFQETLETRVNFIKSNPGFDLYISPGLRGEYPLDSKSKYFRISNNSHIEVLRHFLIFKPYWVNLNVTWNAKSIKDGLLRWDEDVKSYQDVHFHVSALLKGLQYVLINGEPDSLWRTHHYQRIGRIISQNTFENGYNFYVSLFHIETSPNFRTQIEKAFISFIFYSGLEGKVSKHSFNSLSTYYSFRKRIVIFFNFLLPIYLYFKSRKVRFLTSLIWLLIYFFFKEEIVIRRATSEFIKKEVTVSRYLHNIGK